MLVWQLANKEPIDQKKIMSKGPTCHTTNYIITNFISLFTEKLWETCRAVLEQFKPLIVGGMDSYTQKIILLTTEGIWLHRAILLAIDPIKEQYIYWGCCRALASSSLGRPQPIEGTHMKTCVMLQIHALTGGNAQKTYWRCTNTPIAQCRVR